MGKIVGSTALGRFIRNLEAELVAHVGGHPSITQRLLIDRIIKLRLQLDRLDERLDADGELSEHACRLRMAAENRLRLDLVALGLAPRPPPVPTLEQELVRIAAEKAAREGRQAVPSAETLNHTGQPPEAASGRYSQFFEEGHRAASAPEG